MNMDIKNTPALDGARDPRGQAVRPERGGAAAAGSGTAVVRGSTGQEGGGDRVTLTEQAQALLGLSDAEQPVPFDSERVDMLRRAVADGTYQPDAVRIAARLLSMENGQ
ncbi:MAG: flagellar biosynthesis anti-sigma factor FlgM [Pseudomonadales bacterium]